MTALKNAAEIKHMADHGFESVEYEGGDGTNFWRPAYSLVHPLSHIHLTWRIKPATLRINVEIPRPVFDRQTGYGIELVCGGTTGKRFYFATESDRDEAERILVAALRGE
jgi:hypothetical protein